MSEECLRTGDKAKVRFRFIKYPEYLRPGQRLVFREGRTKAVGNVLAVPPPTGQIGVRQSQKPQKLNPQAQGQVIKYIIKNFYQTGYLLCILYYRMLEKTKISLPRNQEEGVARNLWQSKTLEQ